MGQPSPEKPHRLPTAAPPRTGLAAFGAIGVILAVGAPPLLAFNLPPSPTLLNQCLAIALWGAVLAAWPLRFKRASLRDSAALQAALVAVAAAALASGWSGGLPAGLVLSSVSVLACAWVVTWAGAALAQRDDAPILMSYFLLGLVIAGALSAFVALVQVFAADWADGNLIARSGLPGRAVGNLRQPNHLSSLLVWSLVAVVALLEMGRLQRATALGLLPLLVFAVVLSASRTGAVDMLLLALWGALDKRLSRTARSLLIAAPLAYAIGWGAFWLYNQTLPTPSAAAHSGDISSSRFAIWANTLQVIARNPWAGVGFGEFNLAWSMSAFPGRPVAFFDHAHNLPLQFIVEFGWPWALLTLALLTLALVQAVRRTLSSASARGVEARAALMLVLTIGLHSQLEYPLWYVYFLLPAAFAWGYALYRAPDPRLKSTQTLFPGAVQFVGILISAGSLLALADYARVVVIFAPPEGAGPLADRIERGQHSVLFAHHADYAALTTAEPAATQALAMQRAPHHLLDARLMMAWANALAERGQVDRARWVAARLREFRNPAAAEFFSVCDFGSQDAAAGAPAAPTIRLSAPFQCQTPSRAFDWRELVAP